MNRKFLKEWEINGAKVGGYKLKGLRTVYLNLMFRAGSWYEGDKKGIFHLMEHMMHNGGKKFKTRDEIEDYKEKYGISENASTSGEVVAFWFKCADIYLKETLELIEDMVFEPEFEEKYLEKEVKIITQEYYDYWNDPNKRFGHKIMNLVAGEGHPYNHDPIGLPGDLSKISSEDLKELHKQFINSNNMVIGVAGNFDEEEMETALRKILEGRDGELVELNEAKINTKPSRLVYKDNSQQAIISLNWLVNDPMKKIDKKNRLTMNMIKFMLGNGSNSILFRKIREEMGMAYAVGARLWFWPKAKGMDLWASTTENNVDIVVEAMKEEVKKFYENGPDKEKYAKVMNFMNIQTLMYYDSAANISEDIAWQLFVEGKVITPEELNEMAQSITPEEMMEFYKEYYYSKEPYEAIMLNKGEHSDNNGQ